MLFFTISHVIFYIKFINLTLLSNISINGGFIVMLFIKSNLHLIRFYQFFLSNLKSKS